MGGRYEVNSRWTKTAAVASASATPAAVRPRIRPASTTPMPPGDGEAPPIIPASVMTTIRMGSRRWSPKARSETDIAMAISRSRPTAPPASSTSLLGERATSRKLLTMSRTFGRAFSAASLRSLGTASTTPAASATSTTTARMIHTSFESPLRWEPTSRWMDPQANGSEITNSTPVEIQETVAMMAPELSATDAS